MVKEALAAEMVGVTAEMTVAGMVPAGKVILTGAAMEKRLVVVMEEARAVEKAPLRVAGADSAQADKKAAAVSREAESMAEAARAAADSAAEASLAADLMAAAAVHSKRPLSHAHVSKVPRFVSNIVRIRLHRSPV